MEASRRRPRKKGIKVSVFITTIAVFLVLSATMLWSIQVKANEAKKADGILQVEKEQNQQLQQTIDKLEKQFEEANKEIEKLKEEVQELELQNLSKKQNEQEADLKVAYLTFDDGPSANTTKILDILKEKDIKATFFVVANNEMKDTYKRIVDEGHSLGNHTYGHDYGAIYKSPDTFFSDIEKLNDLLEEATGQRTKLIRFPGGSNNTVSRHAGGEDIMDVVTKAVKNEGYRYFDWNVDSQDASKNKQSKDVIVKSVLSGADYTNKAVILMHDAPAKTTTVDALPEIIEGLTKKGFIFRSLDMNSPAMEF